MQNQIDDSAAGRIETNAHLAPERIAVGNTPVVVGRSREATVRLWNSTVSRRHATLRRSDNGFAIEDHDSTYGTFVNGSRIRKLLVQPGDRIRFGTLITYRVDAEGLRRERTTKGMSIAVDAVAVSREGRRIVQDVGFRIAPDAFVGVLGPSGAGKSTVLNSVATFLRPGRGRIVFDEHYDVIEHQDGFRSMMGHVPQDDEIFKALTVRENLTFAARLRLDLGHEDESCLNVEVNRVIELVGLAGHADKRAAVLSGGQKKRLSVAVELLRHPRLLLLDEPTSGLDPGTEAHLMEHLRHISRQGTTVVCTTHLMHNICLFDSVVVLGVLNDTGRVAYCGPPGDLLEHFGCTNFADLYDKLATGQFAVFSDPNTETDSSNAQTPAGESLGKPVPKPGTSSVSVVPSRHLTVSQLVNPSFAADVGRQFANLFERAGLLIRRDRKLLWTMLAQPLCLGLLVCVTQYAASHITSLLFFSIVVAIWMGLNNSVRELVRERKLYIRDRLAGLRPDVYLASKWLVHTVIGAAQLILLLVILRIFGTLLLGEPQADDLREMSLFWLFCVLMACYTARVPDR